MNIKLSDISWRGPDIDDIEMFGLLPAELQSILRSQNGFILHDGALHVRGACREPKWHSLRVVWLGRNALCQLYPEVDASDIPFAEDQVGDQYLIRRSKIIGLDAETGETRVFASSLAEFFRNVESNIEKYLNVGLSHSLSPGELLHVYPPFCVKDANKRVSMRACPAEAVILFHAELAQRLRGNPDGGQFEISISD